MLACEGLRAGAASFGGRVMARVWVRIVVVALVGVVGGVLVGNRLWPRHHLSQRGQAIIEGWRFSDDIADR